MAFDDIFPYLGEFGRYQRRIYFLLCLTAIVSALHKLGGVFLQAKVDHRCQLPFENETATYQLPQGVINMSYPWDSEQQAWSSCRRLDANFSAEYFSSNIPANRSVRCDSWVYDHSIYKSSTIVEWDLVCDSAWLRATADSMFMLGDMIGSFGFGFLSDRYGRKPIFIIALVLQILGGILVSVSPQYIFFMIFRLVVGMTASGVFLIGYVIAMEMVGPSRRLFAGVACQFFFTFGYVLTALLAYLIPDWRMLQLAFTLPSVFFLSYWWFVPESTRWLLSNGRKEQAQQLIVKAAKVNKVKIPTDVLDGLLSEENEKPSSEKKPIPETKVTKPSILDIMRYPNLRKRCLNIFFNWFVNNSAYYGLSWNTSNLAGNQYLNFFISGAVEVPAYTFLLFTLNKWGRKSILCSCMLLGGVSLLAALAVPGEMTWLLVTFAMIGKMAVTASYGTIYIFTAEQFPTVVRNVALGASSTSARAGGMTAPFINLLAEFWQPLPLLVFGAMISVGGFLALLLPETLNRKLPDTLEEGEDFGKENEEDLEDVVKKTGSVIVIASK
ncbi:organic cation transporter protein-like [Schistocerca cancellata]|uniref:organic cation transporter protein-like n=1 Tax=Schistocerca cancellata TaxID=274614 RepID=UPI0021178276|nr:organic cation transporter protein-like [Schistocerca cancellata]XP_049780686.1 organic cation transporter protein-like [Schistocerca cancellata]XP_049780687.1 organic cation transporter protein-like [Schistocerca cancellata]